MNKLITLTLLLFALGCNGGTKYSHEIITVMPDGTTMRRTSKGKVENHGYPWGYSSYQSPYAYPLSYGWPRRDFPRSHYDYLPSRGRITPAAMYDTGSSIRARSYGRRWR